MKNNWIREDLNIAKLPIFQTVKKKGKSLQIIRKKNDEKQMVMVGIVNETEVGTFTTLDYKVFMYLIHEYLQLQNKEEQLTLNLKELLENINITTGGSAYAMIKRSLKRLATIPIFFTNFIRKQNGEHIATEEMMYLIDSNIKFINTRKNGKTTKKITLQISKLITSNLDQHYTKPLIFSEIKTLKNEISIILYRYLDIILASNDFVKKDWLQLSHELCFSYKYVSEVKRAVLPALNELKGKLITTGILKDFKITKTGFIFYKDGHSFVDINKKLNKKIKPVKSQLNIQSNDDKKDKEKENLLKQFSLLTEPEKKKFQDMAKHRAKEQFGDFWEMELSLEISLIEILRENL